MAAAARPHPRLSDLIIPNTAIVTSQLPLAWTGVLCAPLALLPLLCMPPVRDYCVGHLLNTEKIKYYHLYKSSILSWTEFVRVFFEALLALCVGGQVFNEGLRGGAKSVLDKVQKDIDRRYFLQNAKVKKKIDRLELMLIKWLRSEFSWRTAVKKARMVFRILREFRTVFGVDLKNLSQRLVFVRAYYLFPGGLYGMIAYLCFLVVLSMKCLKLYLDSPLFH